MQPLCPPQDSTDKPEKKKGSLQQSSGCSRQIRNLSARVERRGSQFMDGYAGNKEKVVALMLLLNQGKNHCKERLTRKMGWFLQ